MFYPEHSLRKGGRFYWCWVADSWPLCFATISHRQLWSQDIRKICDGLLEVLNNESGRPAERFSLRLSSQLMRGVVRLYHRKVNIMLGDLCMINARVMKNSNKKFNIHEPVEETERQLFPLLELPAPREPAPEPEQRVEEILQQSGNIVANIQDITLKEATIPELQLPVNDGFGEENPNQALQLLQDRTLEQMLGASTSAAHSGLELPAERSTAEPSVTRLEARAQMERISDLDLTLFRKSTGQDLLPTEFEKDIPIPEIPPPYVPVPIEKETMEIEQIALIPKPTIEAPIPEPTIEAPVQQEKPSAQALPVEEEIEELGELEPQEKRRRKNKLIIDKKTMLPSSYFRSRLDNIAVELRCENSSEDIVDLRVPCDILFARPAAAGARYHSKIARGITRLFLKNAGIAAHNPLQQREMELALASRTRRTQPPLEIIPEEAAALVPQPLAPQALAPEAMEPQIEPQLTDEPLLEHSALARPSVGQDLADLLTQKLELTPKRPASQDHESRKRQKTSGFMSFRQHQLRSQERYQQDDYNINDKENIPYNRQTILPEIDQPVIAPEIDIQTQQPTIQAAPEERLTSMLQEAGLADMEIRPETIPVEEEPPLKISRRQGSESSETMLGSLDRTRVSLGDSEHTTDSKRFIRDQWGTEGTMVKILHMSKARTAALTVDALLARGPLLPGQRRGIAARCFTSILKLKQHGFIKVNKDPKTLEILDILLGPKFDNM